MHYPDYILPAAIDYIRLEPLTEEESKKATDSEKNPPPVSQRLFGMLDYTDEVQLWGNFETENDIRAIVYRHKDAGFGRIYWRSYTLSRIFPRTIRLDALHSPM